MNSDSNFQYNKLSTEHVVISIHFLTESTFVLRFTRCGMQFRAGQHLIVGLKGELDQREYSIFSGENDDYLEILVKEVREGNISAKLKHCKPGDLLNVNGPFGSFGIEFHERNAGRLVLIATGTGISPFRSIIKSYPDVNYTLIHGVRYGNEAYSREDFDNERYILCTSKDKKGDHHGRITTYIPGFNIQPSDRFYLCGNGGMIYEVYHILRNKGVSPQNIFSERYF